MRRRLSSGWDSEMHLMSIMMSASHRYAFMAALKALAGHDEVDRRAS
jgi:hypothetical protein